MQLAIGAYTATSAAGVGVQALQDSIENRQTGLRRNDLQNCDIDTWVGRVDGVEDISLPSHLDYLFSRNNQLAWLGLQQDGLLQSVAQLADSVGVDRVGVIMGTSTSSIGRTEEAYRHLLPSGQVAEEYRQPEVHSLHSPGIFVAEATGLTGPAITISTACSSSAKVFASAYRWINQCRPFDRRRNGINIGEGCGYVLVAREDLLPDAQLALFGYGESVDAYHMSHPHPQGEGAVIAIDRALERSKLTADSIDYINLHGTASQANDRTEAHALARRFTDRTLVSSTKAWTGHGRSTANNQIPSWLSRCSPAMFAGPFDLA